MRAGRIALVSALAAAAFAGGLALAGDEPAEVPAGAVPEALSTGETSVRVSSLRPAGDLPKLRRPPKSKDAKSTTSSSSSAEGAGAGATGSGTSGGTAGNGTSGGAAGNGTSSGGTGTGTGAGTGGTGTGGGQGDGPTQQEEPVIVDEGGG